MQAMARRRTSPRYTVYVIELCRDCVPEPCALAPVSVGQTAHTPELADPVAYRRDRRKDQLLQENGYFVLRFLVEDVEKELDAVLDAVLRVLARRRQSATRSEPLRFVRRGGE
jgi:hypothetical protein